MFVPDEKSYQLSTYGFKIFFNALSHPIEYAKVLIQIGHEPYGPVPTTTFLGRPAMKLPNVFQYVKHIYEVDGLFGCYRGMTPKLCGGLFSFLITQKVIESLKLYEEDPIVRQPEEEDDELKSRRQFYKCIRNDIITHSVAIISNNSFNVITVRMMGQFVGKETTYTGILGSIRTIYEENGLSGFFAGLVPRLVGDLLTILLSSTLTYIINRLFIQEKELQGYTSALMSLLSSSVMYPFQVVANCMAISQSGLVAGSPPHMPYYRNWCDCWSDLAARNELKRGSSLLVRYYTPALNRFILKSSK